MKPEAARIPALAGAALLGLLAGLIALSPEVLLFDERYYMEAAYFLAGNFDFVALMQTPLDVPLVQFGRQVRRPRRWYHTCSGEHAAILRGCRARLSTLSVGAGEQHQPVHRFER